MIQKKKTFKKRRWGRNIFLSIFLIILALAITTFLITSNLKISQKRSGLNSQISRLKKEIEILEEKNQKLKSTISESQTEGFLEKEAREKLGLKKPGEEVVGILPPEEKEPEEVKKEKNFWEKILDPVRNFFRGL